MTRIEPGQRLADLLRSQVASLRPRTADPLRAGSVSGPQPSATHAAAVAAGRIRRLAPDDPERKHKAVRIFLESFFLQELGAQLAGDPSFPEMLRVVEERMRADRQIASAADELADLLVAASAM